MLIRPEGALREGRCSRAAERDCRFRGVPARSCAGGPALRSDGSKGGRPAFGHVFMWKILTLQASHSLSDERTEFLIKDRLSFMRFLELELADPVPDANLFTPRWPRRSDA